ncbi:MAG TPA: hypothetical protein VJ732_19260 [Bryobacteraceae bacterium]|nr:hypothetical protein [Bryobacteraceae bacterium]
MPRTVSTEAVCRRPPDVVIASWCGRKVDKRAIRARPGWDGIAHVYEIKSTYILQPGPAALAEGVRQLHTILARVVECAVPEDLRPAERLDSDLGC